MRPLFLSLIFSAPYFVLAQFRGCPRATEDYPAWICKRLDSCKPAQRLIKDERKHPPVNRRCGFMDTEPLVCCPPFDIADWSRTDPLRMEENTQEPSTLPPFSLPATKIPPVDSPTLLSNISPRNTSVAAAKCEEYKKLIYEESESPGGNKSIVNTCVVYFHSTVVGGVNANPKEFPHMALLGYGEPVEYQCGGTLISEKFVLSAAHCQESPKNGPVRLVLLGEYDLDSDNDLATPKKYNIARRIVHEDYVPSSNYNDIMLLELEENVAFSSFIRPTCLHTSKDIPFGLPTVTGWGRLEEVGRPSPILQRLTISIVENSECNEAFKSNIGTEQLKIGIDDNTQICAGGEEDKDACRGDSGGPLQVMIEDCISSQIGIVSFGKFCGTKGVPGVYTRVSNYIPWIERNVWPES